ncbi:hypothetical protein Mal64_20330 [Pseudobythopirellula maris]|uniref:Winged helix-turn-helix domain-containing protein n=1 Tax=Pseudobythopirellula maris TaxID=2527991 RepID=A0A5C5ZN06_9BACT|nr:winged helix-turn-helix domain-containing protein [Pseudobythopirellula maris]TWT88550.1 hypothetical protein Mal64_20330 [Pseudobythopirellula maris]
MAKKSAPKKPAPKTNGASKAVTKKAAPKKSAAKKPAKVKAPASEKSPSKTAATPMLSEELIGRTAGEVWGVLAADGEQTLAAVKKRVMAPGDVVMASIGWLAREGKLTFKTSGRSLKLSLRG